MPFVRRGRRSQDKGAPYPKKRFYNVPVGSDVFAEWRGMRDSLGFSSDDKLAQYLLSKEQTELGAKLDAKSKNVALDVENEVEEIAPVRLTRESKNYTVKNVSSTTSKQSTIQSKSHVTEAKSNATSLRTYLKSRAEQEKRTTDRVIVSQVKTQPPPERPRPRVTIVYDDSQIPLILECETG